MRALFLGQCIWVTCRFELGMVSSQKHISVAGAILTTRMWAFGTFNFQLLSVAMRVHVFSAPQPGGGGWYGWGRGHTEVFFF